MNDAMKKLVREFPATAEGKAHWEFMQEELIKLKDSETIVGGEVELKARQDAIKYIKGILTHFRNNGEGQNKTRYD